MLIVFEGPEGAGKSTQLRLLSEWLVARGHDVVAVREPGGTVLGDEIRRILLDPDSDIVPPAEALLFMASRAQLVERVLRPAVNAGSIVLVDRFFLSTYAYQGAGRGISEDDLAAANRMATAGLAPDLTLLLDLSADEGLARVARRGAHDRIERATNSFHARVAAEFRRFATAEWQHQHPECGPIVVVDARDSEGEVFARVHEVLRLHWPASFPLEV
ncbi:MAG TPA: dTMP kinase [Gemmatimonadaceae bacterium]